ncbi:YD repeat-containing protein [Filimonas lacunae]|uniref:YD repeat-containing protein n=1 Tax=Filimonas lacunae TaxID=477680 RepID=A0A173MAZ6_9BACT|nr:hypothetical protein [Filimonas lacunae]BAV04702.1 hypothetical protein FLA_0701 [Filimonas lacunae]SIT32342.1 YD repeat-containing protein [Filimonas lacunae]
MKRFLLATLLLSGAGATVKAQYYYNDILTVQQTNKQYQSYTTNHIKSISAASFESDGKAAESFEVTQKINADYSQMVTSASYPATGPSFTTHTYQFNQLVSTEDSTARVITKIAYTYNAQKQLSQIKTTTRDGFMNNKLEELHVWSYNASGAPAGMLRIQDGKDTTVVSFQYDEQGNAIEERWTRKGAVIETWYYYYNDKKQLTDIVRYNSRVKRLLPDYLFEYDADGRINQMTQITGSSNYMVWKYIINPQGLKVRDVCLNKQKQMVGRIEYTYTNW